MRVFTLWRLAITFLVIGGVFVVPALDDHEPSAVAQDDGEEDGGDDGNRGHGNDSDDFDEDNPGRGNGNNGNNGNGNNNGRGEGEGDRDSDDQDNDRTGERDDNDDGGAVESEQRPPQGAEAGVSQVEEYLVEVTCEFDAELNTTECSFTGIAPSGATDVGHIDLPAAEVCAEVVDGEFEYVDPDPNTDVTGYKSRGSEASFTLVLQGEVTTAGTATYWFKTGDGVFPAHGPGLRCHELSADAPARDQSESTAEFTIGTGELVVRVYNCTGVPEDTSAFDWFGECEPGGEAHELTLSSAEVEAGGQQSAQTSATGEAVFESLEPGTYELEKPGPPWCHAESDNVTAESALTVEASQRTTVWVFMCDAGTVK